MNTYIHKLSIILFIAGMAFLGCMGMDTTTKRSEYQQIGVYQIHEGITDSVLCVWIPERCHGHIELAIDETKNTLGTASIVNKINTINAVETGTIHRKCSLPHTQYLLVSLDQKTQRDVTYAAIEGDEYYLNYIGNHEATYNVNTEKKEITIDQEMMKNFNAATTTPQCKHIGFYKIYQVEDHKVLRVYLESTPRGDAIEVDINAEENRIQKYDGCLEFPIIDNQNPIETGTLHQFTDPLHFLLVCQDEQTQRLIKFTPDPEIPTTKPFRNLEGHYRICTEKIPVNIRADLLEAFKRIEAAHSKHNPNEAAPTDTNNLLTPQLGLTLTGIALCAGLVYIIKKYCFSENVEAATDDTAAEDADTRTIDQKNTL